ncbi:MAG TPA: carbon monoxide dehydrogenase subunit G [Roseiflexaceae bacterium]|nr:carbon monoxide dehydrogenase subunit G [Roseiflexaceae bacterium]
MKITGQHTIDAPREQVWEALNDLEVLARIVPGCQRLEQVGDSEFEGTLKIGIQAIKGTYHGRIRLEEITPPAHYRLVAKGKGSNGVVDGVGTVDLEEQGGQTLLRYGGEAKIGGTLASIGQRLIEGTARQLINQSLKALTEQIAQRAAPVALSASAAPQTSATPPAPAEHANGSAPPAPDSAVADAAPLAAPPPTDAPQEHAPAHVQPPEPPQKPLPPRRSVEVPDHEQLKPESVLSGVAADLIKDRPWLIPALVGFLLGLIVGRSQRPVIIVRTAKE